jgi:hypothetical protein
MLFEYAHLNSITDYEYAICQSKTRKFAGTVRDLDRESEA